MTYGGRRAAMATRKGIVARRPRSASAPRDFLGHVLCILATAALALDQILDSDAQRVDDGQRLVLRRSARIVGGARRPWPRKHLRHGSGGNLQPVPCVVAVSKPATAPPLRKRAHGDTVQACKMAVERAARRNNRRPAECSTVDVAAARAIVRNTLKLRKTRAENGQMLGATHPSDAGDTPTSTMIGPRECRGGESQGADVLRN